MSGFCTTNYQEICHAFWFKNLEVRKGCFIFECTVLDLNCDRLRESQFGILCSYWSTLKLLPVLLFCGKRPYIESTHTFYPIPNGPCSTCLQLWQSSLVCGSVNLIRDAPTVMSISHSVGVYVHYVCRNIFLFYFTGRMTSEQ